VGVFDGSQIAVDAEVLAHAKTGDWSLKLEVLSFHEELTSPHPIELEQRDFKAHWSRDVG
jgi:hypothetical protein